MKHLILIIIIVLLNSCGDKIYNTTSNDSGGAILFDGRSTWSTNGYVHINLTDYNPATYLIVSRVEAYVIDAADTFYSGSYDVQSYTVDSVEVVLRLADSDRLPSFMYYRFWCVKKAIQ